MSAATGDPVVARLRDEISELDRQLVELVNRRLQAVAELRRYKEENGIPFLDPEREEQLLRFLTETNAGPLSPEGLAALHRHVLELTKQEVAGG